MNRLQLAVKLLTTRAVDLTAANNLFGTLGGLKIPVSTTRDFIPLDNQGGIMDLKGINVNPQWLGLDSKPMQFFAYKFCSPLAAVIDRIAEADSNGKIVLLNEDETPKVNYRKDPKSNRIMNLFNKPNPLHTWEEFNAQQVALCKIYGYCPVFALGAAGLDPSYTKSMWNLNPRLAEPIENPDFDPYAEPGTVNSNPILRWDITIYNKTFSIPAEYIILIKDAFVDADNIGSLGLPMSKIVGMDFWISNILAAMEANNVLLKKKGPLGVFSYDPKPDMAGWTPMSKETKDEIQEDLRNYGLTLGQLQYVVSKTPVKWNSMSFNLQELMTKETVKEGIEGICDRLGYPAELMSGKNATYENRNSAGKFLYESNVIPFSLRRMAVYQQYFGIEGLWMSYKHLNILQEDIVKAGEARKAKSEALNLEWTSGIISYNEYRKGLDLPEIAGKENYFYSDYLKDNPQVQAKLKPIKSTKNAKAA